MDVAEDLGRTLAALGVQHVFGVIGSGNFVVTNALVAAGTRFVAARHECAAVCMADGYARVSGRVGVATVHQGPGFTNAATGLAEAAKSRTPLLLLAADTSAAAVRSNFRIDQAGLAAAVGAVPERIHGPESARSDLERAYRRAVTERRAVVLLMPLDVQAAPAPEAGPPPSPPTGTHPPAPSRRAVTEVAALLTGAQRPAIVAGRGAVAAGAGPALIRLADATGAVLATSANANGLFAGHPCDLGISGGFASPVAAELLADADVVLAVGASLNMWTTRHGTLFGDATTVVQVDLDVAAIGAHRGVDVGVVADAAITARSLVDEVVGRDHRPDPDRVDALTRRIAGSRWRDTAFEDASDDATIDPRTLTIALDELLPDERTVAIDSGHFMGWPAMYLRVPDAAGFVFNQAFQSIGLGLGAAIGAAVARPDRVTVAAVGDGGLMMSLGELETAVRLELGLLVVVYNDAAYGAEVHHFGPHGHPVDLVRFPDTDVAAFGRAAGADAVTVRSRDDLAAVRDWLPRRPRPLVVDVKVTPNVVADWLEEAFRAH